MNVYKKRFDSRDIKLIEVWDFKNFNICLFV